MIISAGFSSNRSGTHVERKEGFEYWSIGIFLKGEIEIKTADRTRVHSKAALALFPPHTPYRLSFRKDEQEIWCLFEPRPELLPFLILSDKGASPIYMELQAKDQAGAIIGSMREMLMRWEQNPPHRMLAENALEKTLMLLNETLAHETAPMDERIRKAASFITERYKEQLTVNGIAEHTAISPSRFAHLFREHTGMTPMQFLERRRMERAQQLLLSTRTPVWEIAEKVGFVNEFHFSTRFRKMTGQSPREYRSHPKRRRHSLSALGDRAGR